MRLNKKLETQLNLYKEFNENQILLHELNKALKQRDQYKEERDKLEAENEKLKQQLKETRGFFVDIKKENKELEEEIKRLKGED